MNGQLLSKVVLLILVPILVQETRVYFEEARVNCRLAVEHALLEVLQVGLAYEYFLL